MTDNVVCIIQLSCIQNYSPVIEYIYPSHLEPEKNSFPLNIPNIDLTKGIADTEKEYKECISLLPSFAFADMNQSMNADVTYMILPASTGRLLYAISFYRKFNSFHLKGNSKIPITIWKSISLLFKVPLFGAVAARLKPVALYQFINISTSNLKTLEDAFNHINSSISMNNFQYEDLFFGINNDKKGPVMGFSTIFLSLIVKAILLERRIVFISKSSSVLSTGILSILALLPGALTLGFPSVNFGQDNYAWKKYGLPLKIFHETNPLIFVCPKGMIGLVSSLKSYVIGITVQQSFSLLQKPVDLLIDLDSKSINVCNYSIYWLTYFTLFDEYHFITSMFDNTILEDSITQAKQSFYVGIKLFQEATSKIPSQLISFVRLSNKYKSIDRMHDTNRESIFEFFDRLFPGATPNWLKKAIDVPQHKRTKKIRLKMPNTSWLPLWNKSGPKLADSEGKPLSEDAKNLYKASHEESKINGFKAKLELLSRNSTKSEDEPKIIAEFEYRVRLVNEYVLRLLVNAAFIATNERNVNYISSITDFESSKVIDETGFSTISLRVLDTDVRLEQPPEVDKFKNKVKQVRKQFKDLLNEEETPTNSFDSSEYGYATSDDDSSSDTPNRIRYKYIEKYVPDVLAENIYELQDDYSYPFLKFWVDSTNAKHFVDTHDLPEFSLSATNFSIITGEIKLFTYSNGDEYRGTTKRMLRHGEGTYYCNNGTIYEGSWKNDKRSGYGVMKSLTNYFHYSGQWKNDMRNGYGHLKTNQIEYWGEFVDNKLEGPGFLISNSGIAYEGQFKDGKFHGSGKLIESGLIKHGEFDQGKLVKGGIVYPTGCSYVGNVMSDLPNGTGIIFYDDEHKFEGNWINGTRFGQGILYIEDQKDDKFNSEFKSKTYIDLINNPDIVLNSPLEGFPSGWVIEATWRDDNLVFDQQFTIEFPNRDKYIGLLGVVDRDEIIDFLDDLNISVEDEKLLLPRGSGLFKSVDTGELYEGEWLMGFCHGRGKFIFDNGISWDGDMIMNLFTTTGNLSISEKDKKTLNTNFLIDREQLLELVRSEDTKLVNKNLKCSMTSFLKTFLQYNPYNLGFLVKSKNFNDLYGDIVKNPLIYNELTGSI